MTIVDLLDRAGLAGRGGAAFPTAVKVRAAHDNGAALIVNACDGEVGAAKDAYVVEHHLAAVAEGARLVAGDRVRYAAHRGSATLGRLRAAGLPVLDVPARYVSSEETSLVSLAHGGLARPMTRRTPFVHGGADSRGRRIMPTVVLNAETLWRVAQVAERGPEWFRAHGTPDEPGPRLVTVGGAVGRPGVLETVAGVPLAEILVAAGAERPLDAPAAPVVVGGLGGALLPGADAWSVRWTGADLGRHGTGIGPGVLHVLAGDRCPLAEVAAWLRYAAGESAGQCGPCMFGVPALAEDWELLAAGPADGRRRGEPWWATAQRLARRAELVRGRGACRFPDGVAGLVGSALRVLADHLDDHTRGGCPLERTAVPA